MDNSVEYIS